MAVKPITPGEVAESKQKSFPDAVFEAFNELIAAKFTNGVATINQDDVVALMVKKGLTAVYENGWLDVESVYEKAGWSVEYDKPAYNESYPATFTFRTKGKKS